MRKAALALGCVTMVAAEPGLAFGLRTHLYIGEQVLKDLGEDGACALTLGVRDNGEKVVARVPQDVCDAVLGNPGYFLAGTIGPDAFPDPIIGQTYIHPGTEDGRQTADWLERMMRKTNEPAEVAFAFGNMLHAAGDTYAHSYVNNYAGDVYGLFSRWRKDVELRHSMIERYIDQRLDYTPTVAPGYELQVPHRLVVRANFEASYFPKNITVDEDLISDLIAEPEKTLALLALEKTMTSVPSWHIRLMRKLIAVSARERQIGPCNEADALRAYIINYRQAVRAEQAGRLHSGIAQPPLPASWAEDPPEGPPCKIEKSPRDANERKEAYLVRLGQQREAARDAALAYVARLRQLRAESYQAGRLNTNHEVANRRKRWLASLPSELRTAIRTGDRDYQDAGRKLRRAEALSRFTDAWAGDVRFAVDRYMEAGLDSARDAVTGGSPYPPPLYAQDGATLHYKRWFGCYRPVFLGKPKEMGAAHCDRLKKMGMDMSLSAAAREAAIGDFFRGPLYAWLEFKEDLDELTSEVLFGITGQLAPTLTGLIRFASDTKRVSHRQLDKTFRRAGTGQLSFKCFSDWIDVDLGIILPPDGGKGIRPDEACRPRDASAPMFFDPERFMPLKHAITLSKLALLDWPALKEVAGPLAGQMGEPTDVDGPYSVILEMVRSLDGSYQWQGYSMPYPRRAGVPQDVTLKEAGYPYPEDTKLWWDQAAFVVRLDPDVRRRPGFPFYRTKMLREKVFAMLFPEPFEGEILRRAEFNGEHYPFTPCFGDPFRRLGLGGGGPKLVCATQGD